MFNFFKCFCEFSILKTKIFKSFLPLFLGLYMFELTSIEWLEFKYDLMLVYYSIISKVIQGEIYDKFIFWKIALPPLQKKQTLAKFPSGLIVLQWIVSQRIGSWKIVSQRIALEKLPPLHFSPINCLLEDFSLKNCLPVKYSVGNKTP